MGRAEMTVWRHHSPFASGVCITASATAVRRCSKRDAGWGAWGHPLPQPHLPSKPGSELHGGKRGHGYGTRYSCPSPKSSSCGFSIGTHSNSWMSHWHIATLQRLRHTYHFQPYHPRSSIPEELNSRLLSECKDPLPPSLPASPGMVKVDKNLPLVPLQTLFLLPPCQAIPPWRARR